ncbi:SDR family oxidoreductase [Rhodococcus sp. (in: high G+C Gram-positive bacteria)]|uniref:SDR family NAD(P)-dependent oxidoreductase n=1 Tax=Rhodococcus sp. TaxID=1831 RepID=UPI00257CD959|nr:SDR family oxidoreductase [Rhodococcus sp. (in: high G+C Gram-positive bacteria)]MBQ9051212.1 SDR family oxidoreductase [Rhodococcus sp. (in: high G+C Gram-positive bacteria)]
MDLGLKNGRVLVTGGGSNVGRGIVHGFAREGARVAICDIDGDQAEKVRIEALELGAAEAIMLAEDLTKEGGAERSVGALLEKWGGIDSLVNNAGFSEAEFFAKDTDRARWQKTIEINLYTAIACTQAALGPMREAQSGSIVFISSDAAFGEIRQGIYGATKAGLICMARTVAKEHGRHGIRSNVVCPGLVLPESPDAVGTGSLWAAGADKVFNASQIENLEKGIPLRRLTTAHDVADAVVFFCSAGAARQITGQVLSVSGGYSMP